MLRIEEMLPWIKGPDVLDVGCTGGAVLPNAPHWIHGRLRSAFHNVWGIDIAADRVEEMRLVGFTNLVVADAQTFDLNKRFDTIVAGELIEHLASPGLFLHRAINHLKPAGRIVLTTPYPFGVPNVLYALAKFPKTCSNPEHAVWICPATMHEQAARAGLRIDHWRLLRPEGVSSGSLRNDLVVRLSRFLPLRLAASTVLYVMLPTS